MKIPSIDFNIREPKKPSFYHIFHSPLDNVYNIFKDPILFTKLFFKGIAVICNCTIPPTPSNPTPNPLKNSTQQPTNSQNNPNSLELDSVGKKFCFIFEKKYEYNFIIEDAINLPYYKTFTHKSLSNNPEDITSKIENIFGFFWDSTDKTTIFHYIGTPEDPKNVLLNYIMKNKTEMCKSVDNYLEQTVKNLEENESITINCPINDVWEFVTDIKNQKIFYPKHKIEVFPKENNLIEVNDYDEKLVITFRISKRIENDDTKYYISELINSSPLLPKQKLEVILIKMNENLTFLIFKHIIFDYIPYDTLMSYSSTKKNAIKSIKKILEEKNDIKGNNTDKNNNNNKKVSD